MGISVVWFCLAAFSALALLGLPFLDDYPAAPAAASAGEHDTARGPWLLIAAAMLALFTFQAGEMAAFAYIIELAGHYGFSTGFISIAVAIGLWIGGPAALLVAWWSTRSDSVPPPPSALCRRKLKARRLAAS